MEISNIDQRSHFREFGGMQLQIDKNKVSFGNTTLEDFDPILNFGNKYDRFKNGINNYAGGGWEDYDGPNDKNIIRMDQKLNKSQEYKESIEFLISPSTRKYMESRDKYFYSYLKDLTPDEVIAKRISIEIEQKYQFHTNGDSHRDMMLHNEEFEDNTLKIGIDGNRFLAYDANKKRTPCTHFVQKGFCQFGNRCKFLHENQNVRPMYTKQGANNNYNNNNNNNNNYNNSKNICCYHYQRGYCRLGDHCKFLHEIELSGHTPVPHQRVCREFQLNNCKFGDNCRFKHINYHY